MQLFVIALLLGLFVHDQWLGAEAAPLVGNAGQLAVIVLLPKVALAALYAAGCGLTLRRMPTAGGREAIRSLEKLTTFYRACVLCLYGMDLYVGLLDTMRQPSNPILLDEIGVMLPTLAMLAWGWWVYYPIDRRMREAAMMGRIDQGKPILPIWTRRQYLIAQFRHQVLMILVPVLLLVGWRESVEKMAGLHWLPERLRIAGLDVASVLILGGTGFIFLFGPVVIRHIWDTAPLPEGELRDRLTRLCEIHNVGVRQLLLWRTFGGMINAAVMGLISPVRYILLTDALLEQVPLKQVEAVMAHEVAHVRRKHLWWLMAVLIASGSGFAWLWEQATERGAQGIAALGDGVLPQLAREAIDRQTPLSAVAMVGMLASVGLLFGWVSRRFERQADTFAVQHLAAHDAPPLPPEAPREWEPGTLGPAARVDEQSVDAMTKALQAVADLNHVPATKSSWRHGSITWRQDYLRTLIGQRVDELAIDRQVKWIKRITGVVIVLQIVMATDFVSRLIQLHMP